MITAQQFVEASLSSEQGTILAYLINTGRAKASKIASDTEMERTLTYRTLDQLVEMELIEKSAGTGKVATFNIAHPAALQRLLNRRAEQAAIAQNKLAASYSDLLTAYNLTAEKPTVQFFEGKEAMERILADALTATETVYLYGNIEPVQKYYWEANLAHVAKREELGIKKKILVAGTDHARKFFADYHRDITDTRLIDPVDDRFLFEGMMQIYDGKVTYLTLAGNSKTMNGIIIHNPEIYDMHRYIFESSFASAQTLS